jgi:predicted histidine transporter YuiF (NhaC family)
MDLYTEKIMVRETVNARRQQQQTTQQAVSLIHSTLSFVVQLLTGEDSLSFTQCSLMITTHVLGKQSKLILNYFFIN